MLRIPGSYNSKCIQRNNGIAADSYTRVRIIQEWNRKRAPIYLLIGSFYAYLIDQRFKEMKRQKQQFSKYRYKDNKWASITIIPWIETLLKTPLDDHRKYVIFRILPRYLINKKGLHYDDALSVINDWLKKCNSLKTLDSNFNSRIRDNLNYAIKSGRLPISLDTLRSENKELYDIIVRSRFE
jgi:Primase X